MATWMLAVALLGQSPAGGIGEGPIIERIQEIRESLDKNAAESRRWNNFVERWEARISTWDGSKIGTFIANILAPFKWVYQLACLLVYALIAVAIAVALDRVANIFKGWKKT